MIKYRVDRIDRVGRAAWSTAQLARRPLTLELDTLLKSNYASLS